MTESLLSYFGSPAFRVWCCEVDVRFEEDFFGMLEVLVRNLKAGDAYSAQMQTMGHCFEKGKENPIILINILHYLFMESKKVEAVFQPVKLFCFKRKESVEKANRLVFGAPPLDGLPQHDALYVANLFTGDGICCFDDGRLERLNLLKPDVFVLLVSSGLFPIGCPTRENTNQTLTAHDIAHMSGFLTAPHYAREMLRLFQHVHQTLQEGDKVVAEALENFDSYYSLRLYYLIEVLCEIRNVPLLEKVIGRKIDDFSLSSCKSDVKKMLKEMGAVQRIKFVSGITDQFHNIISPLGGESRDIFNRHRKLDATALYSAANSKFKQNSLYSLYYDVKKAVQEWRTSHKDFLERFCELCATFIAALVGTAKLSLKDWIDGSMSPVPDIDCRLYQYVDGLFGDEDHLFWNAFCSARYFEVAT